MQDSMQSEFQKRKPPEGGEGRTRLPGGIIFHDVEVWDVDLAFHGADVVIGMDIISQGRLVVETVHGIPMFSFEIEQ